MAKKNAATDTGVRNPNRLFSSRAVTRLRRETVDGGNFSIVLTGAASESDPARLAELARENTADVTTKSGDEIRSRKNAETVGGERAAAFVEDYFYDGDINLSAPCEAELPDEPEE